MKRSGLTRLAPALLTMLALVGLTLSACTTTGRDRALKVSNSIQDVDTEMRNILLRMDRTSATLNALTDPGQVSLPAAFAAFQDALVRLENQGTLVLRREDEMAAANTAYFDEWQTNADGYINPTIRKLSEERRVKLAAIYAQVPLANAGLKEAYLTYLADLKEIRQYLENDLTTKGVQAIGSTAKLAVQQLGNLQAKLKPVIAALDAIKVEMSDGS